MRIHVPYISNQKIGGGYTFFRNFQKGFAAKYPDVQFVDENEDHDILFAFSPSTINGETIERSKKKGAKFVLRMDGVPEDSRNSGRGTRRMVEYALKADFIVYQSDFLIQTVGKILKNNGVACRRGLIRNGVDVDTFTPFGDRVGFKGKPNILHVAYRKDNNKRYEEVLAMYREYWTDNKDANLVLLGRYPTEWTDYNMGFFNGERYQRMGVLEDQKAKAAIMRSCDVMFYPSFADPAPNVVLEALACGVPVVYCRYGGTEELIGTDAGVPIQYGMGRFQESIEYTLKHREEFSQKAREIALGHTLEMTAMRYKEVFDLL